MSCPFLSKESTGKITLNYDIKSGFLWDNLNEYFDFDFEREL